MADIIKYIFSKQGSANYIGEDITQIEHMYQAATLAVIVGEPVEFIIACFLHDIGHLLNEQIIMEIKTQFNLDLTDLLPISSMHNKEGEDIGNKSHEELGAILAKRIGLPAIVSDLIRNHINGKRYLVTTDETYKNRLSNASYATFVEQGGIMTENEVKEFETQKNFEYYIRIRLVDERAKLSGFSVTDKKLEYFYLLLDSVIEDNKEDDNEENKENDTN
jgi:putative nucleotidyltransferase with HDIG domain